MLSRPLLFPKHHLWKSNQYGQSRDVSGHPVVSLGQMLPLVNLFLRFESAFLVLLFRLSQRGWHAQTKVFQMFLLHYTFLCLCLKLVTFDFSMFACCNACSVADNSKLALERRFWIFSVVHSFACKVSFKVFICFSSSSFSASSFRLTFSN